MELEKVREIKEFQIQRTLPFMREKIFNAWTDPELFKRWFGPYEFTMPFCQMNVKTDGQFHYCMRSPEGTNYWSKGTYLEVLKPERIVYTDSFSDKNRKIVSPTTYGLDSEWPMETLTTINFKEKDHLTILTVHVNVPESLAREQGAVEGWNQTLNRLSDELAKSLI